QKHAMRAWSSPMQLDTTDSRSLPCRAFLPVNGEKEAGPQSRHFFAPLAIGETDEDSVLRPVHGEKMPAGR
ncbi:MULTISPECIES: hypothetical protein, partial [unclassified Mesorhizobium]|uniref:hypothetical protein n=1 Tax=unclassified Mesorhizobium TaxID=325217 RepID=UPI0019D4A845